MFVYVGTYTEPSMGDGKGIYVFQFESGDRRTDACAGARRGRESFFPGVNPETGLSSSRPKNSRTADYPRLLGIASRVGSRRSTARSRMALTPVSSRLTARNDSFSPRITTAARWSSSRLPQTVASELRRAWPHITAPASTRIANAKPTHI